MLQASEMQKRFTHLQQTVSEASQTCHAVATIPKDLMKWVDELDNECKSAKKVMSSRDEDRIRQWVDDLEQSDSIVPARFGEALYHALADPKQLMVVKAAEHNDWIGHIVDTWWQGAIGFLLAPSH
ncbi:hypothetical protein [Paraburkholderia sp. SIMBA_030]|uniref:hypothetical protein n=1 Tax=Paraburkholderia sp. SIMBA_030 TaxID=3085773 RepID=UPI00397952BA